jgi:hypothetical protein
LADFAVYKWILENATKVLAGLATTGVLTLTLTQVWPPRYVDMIKRVISDYWLGFRGDDPGWPRFN